VCPYVLCTFSLFFSFFVTECVVLFPWYPIPQFSPWSPPNYDSPSPGTLQSSLVKAVRTLVGSPAFLRLARFPRKLLPSSFATERFPPVSLLTLPVWSCSFFFFVSLFPFEGPKLFHVSDLCCESGLSPKSRELGCKRPLGKIFSPQLSCLRFWFSPRDCRSSKNFRAVCCVLSVNYHL